MRALVIGGVAGRLDRLEAVLERGRAAQAEAVFVLGNLAPGDGAAGSGEVYAQALARLAALGIPVYLIPGENDAPLPALSQALQAQPDLRHLTLVHRATAPLPGGAVAVGFGGRLTTTEGEAEHRLRFPAWEARVAFENLAAFSPLFQTNPRRIFLFGSPPQGKVVDRGADGHHGIHILNRIIQAYQPACVLCAASTPGRGVEVVDGSVVVNPGAVADGAYALVNLDDLDVQLGQLADGLVEEGQVFRTILVALDGSAEAWRALELAAGLARAFEARLVLMHAFEPIPDVLGEPFLALAIEERTTQGEQLLDRAAALVAELDAQTDLVEGPAADAILRVADTQRADLIVMGARGLGRIRALLGSVSQRVVSHAPCPVLIAHQPPVGAAFVAASDAQRALAE